MAMLGRYEKTTELSNKNAGSCSWCFAVRGGQEYFIKEFKEPKHPETDTVSSPEKKAKKLKKCEEFERKKSRMYQRINDNSDGNAVRVVDFFRIGAKYYMAMPKIKAVNLEVEGIAQLPEQVKRRICTVIAHAVIGIHKAQFVHADIKHSNVLMVYSKNKNLTAKLIDYDAGFFEYDPPKNPEEIHGDTLYFSPEAYLAQRGEGMHLTCKMDVFALGVLFHQYLTGKEPEYQKDQFESTGEAVSLDVVPKVSRALPKDLYEMICRMLSKDPEQRPDVQEVYSILSGMTAGKRDTRTETDTIYDNRPFIGDALTNTGWEVLGDLN